MTSSSHWNSGRLLILVIILVLLAVPFRSGASAKPASSVQNFLAWKSEGLAAPEDKIDTLDTAIGDIPAMSKLIDRGPQFPDMLDMSNFAVFFVVRGGWPVVIKYELRESHVAVLSIDSTLYKRHLRFDLAPTYGEQPRTVVFRLPQDWGDIPQVVLLRLTGGGRAAPGTNAPDTFTIHTLGVGDAALTAKRNPPPQPPGMRVPGQLFSHADSRSPVTELLEAGEVAIDGLILTPPDVFNATQGANLSFSFRSSNDFNKWAATFQRLSPIGQNRTTWKVEKRLPFFNEPINQGQTVTKNWDGKNNSSNVVPGTYKLVISAWTAADMNTGALTTFSSPPLRVN